MKKLTIGLCAAALALTGIACGDPGGDEESARSLDALVAAADKVTDAGSSAMSMTMTMDVAGEEITAEGEGTFDYVEQTGQMTMAMAGDGLPGAVEMEMIVDGDVAYMKMPEGLGAPGGWYRMDAADVGSGVGGANQLSQDPAQFVEFLRGASEDDIEEVGTEEIRGVSTTHYKAELSFEKMIDQATDPEAADEMRAKLDAIGGEVDSIPAEVWIDAEGLPRRMEMTMSIEGGGESAEIDITVDLFDYGVEVDVDPPKEFHELPDVGG